MTIWGLSIADFTALLMMGLSLVSAVVNVFLWLSTRQTVQLLLGQVRHQVVSTTSEAQYDLVGAHRELFLGILQNPGLLQRFTEANGLDSVTWELNRVSSFLINQVWIGFLHFHQGLIDPEQFEGFKRDAQEVFAYATVREHWQQARLAHSELFRRFVDTELLWSDS